MSKSVYEFDATMEQNEYGVSIYPTKRKPEEFTGNLIELCNGGSSMFRTMFAKGENKAVRVAVKVKHFATRPAKEARAVVKNKDKHSLRFPMTILGYMDGAEKFFEFIVPRAGTVDLGGRWPSLTGARALKLAKDKDTKAHAIVTMERI